MLSRKVEQILVQEQVAVHCRVRLRCLAICALLLGARIFLGTVVLLGLCNGDDGTVFGSLRCLAMELSARCYAAWRGSSRLAEHSAA